jgi:hypothetical protein
MAQLLPKLQKFQAKNLEQKLGWFSGFPGISQPSVISFWKQLSFKVAS